jgi:hypothetical protein
MLNHKAAAIAKKAKIETEIVCQVLDFSPNQKPTIAVMPVNTIDKYFTNERSNIIEYPF